LEITTIILLILLAMFTKFSANCELYQKHHTYKVLPISSL
jgi:hypothetical protein